MPHDYTHGAQLVMHHALVGLRCSRLDLRYLQLCWTFADICASELAREKMWSRIHLIPVLQAEEDRDQVRRMLADKKREKELLGAETKVYNSDRYVYIH